MTEDSCCPVVSWGGIANDGVTTTITNGTFESTANGILDTRQRPTGIHWSLSIAWGDDQSVCRTPIVG